MKKMVMLASFGLCGLSTVAVVQAQPEATKAATAATTAAPAAQTPAPAAAAPAAKTAATPAPATAATTATATPAAATPAPMAAAPAKPVAKKPIPQDPPHVQRMIALYPDLIKRIAPYGNACVQGKTCSVSVPVVAVASAAGGAPKSGEEVYQGACTTCHSIGMLGSPKTGDKAAWAPRIAKGKETLYTHAINGFNSMPARGGAELSDQEVKNGVDYLVSKAQ